jgi:hypothetical protein
MERKREGEELRESKNQIYIDFFILTRFCVCRCLYIFYLDLVGTGPRDRCPHWALFLNPRYSLSLIF